MRNTQWQQNYIAAYVSLNALDDPNNKENRTMNYVWLVAKCWTPIEAIWRRAIKCLDSCPHNDNEMWQMTLTKIEGALPKEIKIMKNNPPKLIELN
ncbi:hypothetical protein G9A89_022426 [Geosiphon pyriformis]|nr:hypothetical protein G9A89_022426 [Geosiphon pyriformis]